MSNIKKAYQEKYKAQIQKELGLGNVMQVPKLEKIVVNMGLGEAIQNAKLIEAGVEQMRAITGQAPVVTKSKNAISNFKLREVMPIGVRVVSEEQFATWRAAAAADLEGANKALMASIESKNKLALNGQ